MNAIETMNNEELDNLKVQIKTREQAIKLESAQGIIKQIYAGCYVNFTLKGEVKTAQVGYINLKGCSVTTPEGEKKFVEFERITEVTDSLVEAKPVEKVAESAEVSTSTPLFGKKKR